MVALGVRRKWRLGVALGILLGLCSVFRLNAGTEVGTDTGPAVQAPALSVTQGLIRWWPNLFDARDEMTGQEGLVMGVLPPVQTGADDCTEFDRLTGWVQLQPAITNEVFTLAFWIRYRPDQFSTTLGFVGQQAGECEWLFQASMVSHDFWIGRHQAGEADNSEAVHVTLGAWHHLSIARRRDGTSVIWVDGIRAMDGTVAHAWPAGSRWLSVGNVLRGREEQFNGALRDLCAYDRVLSDDEARALHAAGLPRCPARNTPARLAATRRPIPEQVSTNLPGANPGYWTHRKFTTEDGLPGNIVRAVLQASNGYLWVGTDDGLARFDGRDFKAFTAESDEAMRVAGQKIWSLAEAADGTIWAGAFGGLLRIRGLEFRAFTNGLPQRFILQAQPAADGSIWVAGFNAFVPRGPCWLRRYHPDSGTSSAEVVVPGHIRRLVVATNGVWLATEQPQQMHFWDGTSAATTVVGAVDDAPASIRIAGRDALPPGSEVQAWKGRAEGGRCWAQVRLGGDAPTFGWLWAPENTRPKASRWSGPPATDTWLGVSCGLARLRGDTLEQVQILAPPGGPEVSCLCANREGGVWFGTGEDGLHFVQERMVRVFTTEDGLSGNDVRSVCAAPDGTLWAATAGGLSHWAAGKWTNLGPHPLRGIACDGQGTPWFGCASRGRSSLQRDRSTTGSTSVCIGLDWQDPNSLRFARDGTLWVVCEGGLTWLDPARLVKHSNGWHVDPGDPRAFGRYAVGKELPDVFPIGLVEDQDGSFWVGSMANGLFHISHGRVESFGQKEGLPGHQCIPVSCDDAGSLWMMCDGRLARRAGGRFQVFATSQGMPRDFLLDLIDDGDGHFWISGKRGIHCVARKELDDVLEGRADQVRCLTLGGRDGLLTPECSSRHYPTMARTPDGHIWVSTLNGLATFNPRQVRLDTQPMRTSIERLVINRKELPLARSPGRNRTAQSLHLSPGSGRQLEFHYAATSLLEADRVKFRHRLDGHDSEWSPETDLRLAFFTNLRPGSYRFRVKAANAHGIWSDQETELPFVILPHFWETTAFHAIAALAVLAIVGALHRQRVLVLRDLQEMRHRQHLDAERARIASDMHDDLGAALTQIAILGEVAKRQAHDFPQSASLLDRISQSAREVTARMSDLVWATNPRHDSLDNLSAQLREQAARSLQDTGVRAALHFPHSVPTASVSASIRRNVLLVMKEAVTNAVRHAHPSEIRVAFAVGPDGFRLEVEDNGSGFDAARKTGAGNGLRNMCQRMADLGGTYELVSEPGAGTRVSLTVPLERTRPR